MSTDKIVVENLYKIFGSNPEQAFDLLNKGYSKDDILRETGQVLGVNNVSFTVREGEIFVLMGLSGSGKSTLIRLINRLIEPSAGDVFVDGQNVSKMGRAELTALRRRDMSMVFQSFALMPHRTVLENAAFGLEVGGVGKDERERRAMQTLEQVGLAAFANKRPFELSGGMQQRVGLARAFAVDPSLILMDEAFSALDPLKRREMQDVLLDLQREQQRTIIFVSHDLEEALRIGSRIAIMKGGVVVQVGTPHEVVNKPADEYVRAFFNGVDTSRYLTAADILEPDGVPVITYPYVADNLENVDIDDQGAFLLGEDKKFQGFISNSHELSRCKTGASKPQPLATVPTTMPLNELMDELMKSHRPLPVVNENGAYCGALCHSTVLKTIAANRGGE
jgi:glycine betaine/proline transport system ATP-binding protein